MRQLLFCLAFFCWLSVPAQTPLLDNPQAIILIKKGTHHIYNMQYAQANTYIDQLQELLPEHPVAPMMRALNINWHQSPLETDSKEFADLNKYLSLALSRTESILEENKDDIEGIFFAMAIHSWRAQFYDEDGSVFKALSAAKSAYHYMKKGFDLTDQSPEFYFSTGLYNYYRVQYPESNPVYKPFMWFFRDGDKLLGLKQLKLASQKALFTRPEAAMYLAHVYLRYEKDPLSAMKYSGSLVEKYPKNQLFKINYVEALLAAEKYQEAKPLIENLLQLGKPYYLMSAEIFQAIYLEKQQKDDSAARAYYQKGIQTGEPLEDKAENKLSLAYAGLARIAHRAGKNEQARSHYKKATKLAQYQAVKDEAKKYLNAN